MNDISVLGSTLTKHFESIAGAVIGFLPQLLIAILALLVGWLAARFLRAVARRLTRGLERFAGTVGMTHAVGNQRGWDTTVSIVGSIVYWLVILVSVTLASRSLGLMMFTGWLDRIVTYLPTLISGAVIIFAGFVISRIVRDTVVGLASTIPENQRTTLGRAAQILTLTTMVIVGVDQIGIHVDLISTLVVVVVGTFLAGLSIAFSLGARSFVSNLLGIRYLGRSLSIGQKMRVDGIVGTLVEISQTSIVLDTEDGQTRIPGNFLSDKPVVIINGAGDRG